MVYPVMQRRGFGQWVAAAAAAAAWPSWGQEVRKPYLADMHSHYGMFMPRPFGLDMAKHMRETGTTLLAWAVTDDHRWISNSPRGWQQTRQPQPGELWESFQKRLADNQAKLQGWGLAKALVPADVDAALAGEPRIVLATEAANFLEGDPARVAQAHAWGVRHMQMVHFIHGPLGDHQTAEPRHGGLAPAGAKVIAACKQHGIVVDLAHSTAAFVDGALDASDAAMVWSHSWISPQGGNWQDPGYIARSLSLASARKIAARGGAVGLWSVRVNRDPAYPVHNVKTFADEMLRMADLVGPEHVAFGTDMEGAGSGPILHNYADLRDVADNLVQRGVAQATLHAIFIGNYARILKAAMHGASTT
ncbi:membrane dipeptidase [uncultured Ramlibacter sp.]|uniref:dipeptidase n=1 Tax=uncultured Ramlibacter sp. TaxID=260755 RepID=UPI002605012F|nr:membrane dipeptidase [uncultured Ramlibacter sp.]